MPLTRIHVNQHVIRRNKREGRDDPPLTVKVGRMNTYCRGVELLGPSRVVYSPCRPLSCGARVWIETTAPVRLEGVEPGDAGA
jgi:hypothetical protein